MDKNKAEKIAELYKLCDELGIPRPVFWDGVWRVEVEGSEEDNGNQSR